MLLEGDSKGDKTNPHVSCTMPGGICIALYRPRYSKQRVIPRDVSNLSKGAVRVDGHLHRKDGRCCEQLDVTAGFILVDRFAQNRASICCLLFDRIGVRHPGIRVSAGSLTGLK